jgi:hypothetical protein
MDKKHINRAMVSKKWEDIGNDMGVTIIMIERFQILTAVLSTIQVSGM